MKPDLNFASFDGSREGYKRNSLVFGREEEIQSALERLLLCTRASLLSAKLPGGAVRPAGLGGPPVTMFRSTLFMSSIILNLYFM